MCPVVFISWGNISQKCLHCVANFDNWRIIDIVCRF